MTHGELFAGISGFGCGFDRAGCKTLWHVEIDAKCRSILARHYPGADLIDDVATVGKHNLCSVDVITFGSPCQDLSVAGKRKGLDGERSGLFFEAIRVVRELRPAFAVWENVPGAFSSNAGRDFAAVLGAFRDIGARDIAWTVLDSQYRGLAQRRRRGRFDGDTETFIAFDTTQITSAANYSQPKPGDPCHPLAAGMHPPAIAHTLRAEGHDASEDGTGRDVPLTVWSLTTKPYADNEAQEDKLVAAYQCHGSNVGPMGAIRAGNGNETGGVPFVPVSLSWQSGGDCRIQPREDQSNTLNCDQTQAVHERSGVRRLTPRECERLQGFPDDWTRWGANGEEMSDSARYRMLGNAISVPIAEWLARRIMASEQGG